MLRRLALTAFLLIFLALPALAQPEQDPPFHVSLIVPGSEWRQADTFTASAAVFADTQTQAQVWLVIPPGFRLDVVLAHNGRCYLIEQPPMCYVDLAPGQPAVIWYDLTVLPNAPAPNLGELWVLAVDQRGYYASAATPLQIIAPTPPRWTIAIPLVVG
jgi:hypothetical protein